MQQLSFDNPNPAIPSRPTAKQLTSGEWLACSQCGKYSHNPKNATGLSCPCGAMATKHGAYLAARYHYGIPLPVGVLDPLANNRMVVSEPGPSCPSRNGGACPTPESPCWTDTESTCHMPTQNANIPSKLDPAGAAPHLVEVVTLYNGTIDEIEKLERRKHEADIEVFRAKKERDEAKVVLKRSQSEMDIASRDRHEINMQLEKLWDGFNQVKEMMGDLK